MTMTGEDILALDHENLWHPYASLVNPAPLFPVASAEGVRIRLAEPPYDPGSGRYSIRMVTGVDDPMQDIPTITNELMDLKTPYGDTLTMLHDMGMPITRMRGIVTYFYGVHLSPRSAEDITF